MIAERTLLVNLDEGADWESPIKGWQQRAQPDMQPWECPEGLHEVPTHDNSLHMKVSKHRRVSPSAVPYVRVTDTGMLVKPIG